MTRISAKRCSFTTSSGLKASGRWQPRVVRYILNAPAESTYEDLLVLKTISLLMDQALDAFLQGHLKGEDADGIESEETEEPSDP